MALPLEELQKLIGYQFQNIDYLQRAMTHSSYANETGAHNHHLLCNERLEFWGIRCCPLSQVITYIGVFPIFPRGI